jgi:hypothetical protein
LANQPRKPFFNITRRQVGHVVLALAILTFAEFGRSFFGWDRLFITAGPQMHIVTSADGWFTWYSREVTVLESYNQSIFPEWKSIGANDARQFTSKAPPGQWSIPIPAVSVVLTMAGLWLLRWFPWATTADPTKAAAS